MRRSDRDFPRAARLAGRLDGDGGRHASGHQRCPVRLSHLDGLLPAQSSNELVADLPRRHHARPVREHSASLASNKSAADADGDDTSCEPSVLAGCGDRRLSFSHTTDEQFCSTHLCIENFPNGDGYIVQCVDGEWRDPGGLSGAYSDHGGES